MAEAGRSAMRAAALRYRVMAMAARSPGATVWAVDVNERALALCERNAAAAGLTNVRYAPDAPGLPASFAEIWSNPPVRIGKPALHELLRPRQARYARKHGNLRFRASGRGPRGPGRPRGLGGPPGRRRRPPGGRRSGMAFPPLAALAGLACLRDRGLLGNALAG